MADILALVLLHDEKLVEQSVATSLTLEQPSKHRVLNSLSRLSEAPIPKPLCPPPALRLITEPAANTKRYDSLREGTQ